MALDKSWIDDSSRLSDAYQNGIESFLAFAFKNDTQSDTRCPCTRCKNSIYQSRSVVKSHCFRYGFDPTYKLWHAHGESRDVESDVQDDTGMYEMIHDAYERPDHIYDGSEHTDREEEPNTETAAFYRLLDDAKENLYPGCPISKLAFVVRLMHWKSYQRITNTAFDEIVSLIRDIVPAVGKENIPESHYKAKTYISNLGLECQKIHACPNDCVLYRGQYAYEKVCPKCGTSRYMQAACVDEDAHDKRRKDIPQKVLRYFPLIKRLQRLYSCRKTASDMMWHSKNRGEDVPMTHPSDSPEWKSFDLNHPQFSAEPRNVRLALATDGFQPFGNLSSLHSIWPVILIPYNLPPWMCMKNPYWMLSLVIPGPRAPGMDIDVYLEPLIDDLKKLWDEGVDTYDAHLRNNFRMHAALLWTISDFPALADLSGWSTKGKLACLTCYNETSHRYLKHSRKLCYMGHRRFLPQGDRRRTQKSKFDGTAEHGVAPRELTGEDILRDLHMFTPDMFGKVESRKRKYDTKNSRYHWRKRSIFFELPYWKTLTVRHCLDVMHTEKNVSQNIISTLLNIKDKTKDTPKSRDDLKDMNIRKELHLRPHGSNSRYMPPAIYTFDKAQKAKIFEMLKNLKTPDAYMSNISRCINVDGKSLSGLKSHDYHILLQQLLPIMIKGLLSPVVTDPLIGLSSYFKNLCARALKADELKKMENDIVEILCRLEQVFPPSFFTSMVHITMHLAKEARMTGPVQFRWMYPIERDLRRLKNFVRNKARPAGSIAEAYLADECMTFCSRYLEDIDTSFNRPSRNEDESSNVNPKKYVTFKQGVRMLGAATAFQLTREEHIEAHFFVLNNVEEIYKNMLPEYNAERKRRRGSKIDKQDFVKWVYNRVIVNPNQLYEEGLISLAEQPNRLAHRFSGCVTNGFRFHSERKDQRLKTFNHGVMIPGDDLPANIAYYGKLVDILEITYHGDNKVALFKCDWFNVKSNSWCKIDRHGITSLHKYKTLKPDDMFIFADQASQVIYVEDLTEKDWYNVIHTLPRDSYNILEEDDDYIQQEAYDDTLLFHSSNIDVDTLINSEAEGEVITLDDIDETPIQNDPNFEENDDRSSSDIEVESDQSTDNDTD